MRTLPQRVLSAATMIRGAILDMIEHVWFDFYRPRHLTRWLTGLSLAVSLGTLLLGFVILWDMRNETWHRAIQASDNLIGTLSKDIARNIELYDLSLRGAQKAWGNPQVRALDPELMRLVLFDASSNAEYLGTMFITDAAGQIVVASADADLAQARVADRAHFLAQRQRPDVGLYISRVFIGNMLHEPIIALTRRISNPDGSFNGIVEGVVRTAFFRDLFAQLDIGAHGYVALFRDDGYIIMRRPYQANDLDLYVGDRPNFSRYRDAPHGHFINTTTTDQIDRIYTYHHIEGLPLVISIALAVDDIYAQWRRKAISLGIVLVLLCAASVALSLSFRREILRRRVAEQNLVEAAKRLYHFAATDGLTGVANRRSFEQALDREWRRAIRNEAPIAVMMLDVDHFKSFNDRYGHQSGDDTLKAVAASMAGWMRRPGDIAARYGGEEFIAVLPDTELAGVLNVAESIRQAIAAQAIPHETSPIGYVTISIGVAVVRPGLGDAPATLVKQADQALYAAKRAGRNQVMSAMSSTVAILSIGTLPSAAPPGP